MNTKHYIDEARLVFKEAFSDITRNTGDRNKESVDEAAFPAYAHGNFFIDRLFWGRLRVVEEYLLPKRKDGETLEVLDFGCGSGVMSYALAEAGYNVTMTDIDPRPLEYMKENIDFPKNTIWANAYELHDRKFDFIIALDVLEHVDDVESEILSLGKMLKKDGELIVSGPTENKLYHLGRRLAGKRFTGHYHKTTIDDIRDVCKGSMNVADIATLYPVFPLFKVFSARNQ
jgi:2-polyprenyl-3-methyl-5-hydroxy-6-metoxy-1,4-benzoquinol methylase